MVGYEVEIQGLEEQLRKLEGFDGLAGRELRRAMDESVITIVSAVRPLTPVGVSGLLRNSIASEVTGAGTSIEGKVGSTLKEEVYPAVMEFGRHPRPVALSPGLYRWVELKLGVPEADLEKATRGVAAGIAKRGIKGRFFLKRGWEASKGKVEDFFAAALERIAVGLENGRK